MKSLAIVDNPTIPVLQSKQTSYPIGQFVEWTVPSEGSPLSSLEAKDLYLPNFSVRSVKGKAKEEIVFENQAGTGVEFPGSCLILQGTFKSFMAGGEQMIESFNGSQNFKYDPENELLHSCPADDPFHFLHFSYTAEYFNEFLPEGEEWTYYLKDKVNKKQRMLGERYTPISLAQERAWQNIVNCPIDGKLGLFMMESSIIQILVLQLHSLFSDTNCSPTALERRDAEIANGVKEYLVKTYLDDHSLTDLARHFGTNTGKLMSLFKKYFGKSIFEFITELRMDHASQLLREKDARVVDVARTLGYKNANHFSTAFKRHYGMNPSQIR